ncbi:MAG: 4Fe-4S dicluster domain-containing protein [Raoultibacter sp.]
MTRYGMVIDTKRCFGCQTCAIACKTANNLPIDIRWNHIITSGGTKIDIGGGSYPNVDMVYYPVACQHCAKPACVDVCPTGASTRNDDGVVVIDAEKCIGCKACMSACPYDARVLLEDEPKYYLDYAVGDGFEPAHRGGVVEKCNFCHQRISEGRKPACMELCPGRARLWGDLDDPDSEASKALKDRKTMRYLENEGTEPSTYYLI